MLGPCHHSADRQRLRVALLQGAVEFEDGRSEPDVDAVLWATGYVYDFPFFGPEARVTSEDNRHALTWPAHTSAAYEPHSCMHALELTPTVIRHQGQAAACAEAHTHSVHQLQRSWLHAHSELSLLPQGGAVVQAPAGAALGPDAVPAGPALQGLSLARNRNPSHVLAHAFAVVCPCAVSVMAAVVA